MSNTRAISYLEIGIVVEFSYSRWWLSESSGTIFNSTEMETKKREEERGMTVSAKWLFSLNLGEASTRIERERRTISACLPD